MTKILTTAVSERPKISIIGSIDHFPNLAAALYQLGYSSHLSRMASCRVEFEAPAAAIIIDTTDKTLEWCSSMSAECPVLLVSSDSSFSFRFAALKAGITALLRPPINHTELAEWLNSIVASKPLQPASVVIVDDDRLALDINAEILRSAGMTVETASDPMGALDLIESNTPDLVLMDMQMPLLDGIGLARLLRQKRQFISMPIVFLSGERDEGRQLEARKFGGDDFISKSIDPERLISLVAIRAERARLLRSMIERDGLTGLYDHNRFKERLAQELERSRRVGTQFSLAILDIDHFKNVNDRHGHSAGDVVIRTLADELTAGLRKIDVIGRYGGEEFAIMLLDTGPLAAQTALDNLRKRFSRNAFNVEHASFMVTFSGGVAYSRDFPTFAGLVDAADKALYKAKNAGRNNICVAQSTKYSKPDTISAVLVNSLD